MRYFECMVKGSTIYQYFVSVMRLNEESMDWALLIFMLANKLQSNVCVKMAANLAWWKWENNLLHNRTGQGGPTTSLPSFVLAKLRFFSIHHPSLFVWKYIFCIGKAQRSSHSMIKKKKPMNARRRTWTSRMKSS